MRLFVMDYINTAPPGLRRDLEQEVARHKSWYVFEGILCIVMGILAIVLPGVTTLTVSMLIGTALVIGSILRLAAAARSTTARGWRVLSGLLFLAAGATMLWWPLAGVASLIILTGVLLLAEGFLEIFLSMTYRLMARWGLLLASGILSLILGIFVLAGFPAIGILVIALAVGLNLVFYGVSVLTLAWGLSR
jgi:uncharacterized membrane protein HdeD (DUF308 family)